MDKLVLDTTYLLPIFGISVKLANFKTLFPKILNAFHVLYNPVSVVEAKWIALRVSRREPPRRDLILSRFRTGLKALLSDERLSQTALTNPEVEVVTDKLLMEGGVSDYFDRLIYATAVYYDAILLTEDEELHRVSESASLPKPKEVLRWADLISRVRK